MNFLRMLCIVPLTLISLLNVGYPFGTSPDEALSVAAVAPGLAGFVAAFGLARSAGWGVPAALTVGALNVVGAIAALASDAEGALVGVVISSLALAMAFVAGVDGRKVASA
ncbi:hypothetical protein [Nocardioides sp. B-3]|uniref:hypothetical protein n=1 Tax=Nocardioides sp. B-3 TaxID=2895565 RepID=UPI002152123F|nr:hypothetical protein [Nocardioides sp. B-3]UUZ58258.1 hypothetical protein LP418_18675 [Nocardioides sp. B-3]